MPVSLLFSADEYALTRGGRLHFRLHGSRTVADGVQAVSGITISGALADGHTIRLQWGEHVQVLTVKNNPSEPGEIPAGNGSSAYADTLAAYLAGYYPFREDFVVSRDSLGSFHSIIFTAKQPGPAYNVISTSQTGPWFAGVVLAGQLAIERERYCFYVEIHLAAEGADPAAAENFSRIYRGFVDPDQNGNAVFDAGSILHNELTAELPHLGAAMAKPCTRSARAYFISYAEAWGNTLQIASVQNTPVRFAYLGGADFLSAGGSGYSIVPYKGIQPSVDRAFRQGPRNRYVRINEPQFLTFINQRTAQTAIGLKIRLVFSDNSTLTRTDLVEPVPFAAGAKVIFPVGIAQLGLSQLAPPGEYLTEYYVRLARGNTGTAGDDYSYEYRYILDYAYRPYTRYFLFLSSLGSIDSLATYGKGSAELLLTSQQAERSLSTGYDPADGQLVDYDVQLQRQFEVSTGFRHERHLERWADLYRSPAKYLLPPSLKAIPVGIVSRSIKEAKDGDNLFAHQFSYTFLYTDMFFLDEPEYDENPPPGFCGTGSVSIEQPSIVQAVDNTIPAAVRDLTAEDLAAIRQIAGLSGQISGLLTTAAADQIYPRKNTTLTKAQADGYYLLKSDVSQSAPLRVGSLDSDFQVSATADYVALAEPVDTENPAVKRLKIQSLDDFAERIGDILKVSDKFDAADAKDIVKDFLDELAKFIGINYVLNNENRAEIEIQAYAGATIACSGVDEDGNPVALRLKDLQEAPDEGIFRIIIIEETTNTVYSMTIGQLKAFMDGQAQTGIPDQGLPVMGILADRVYTSGEKIGFEILPVTRANGEVYRYLVSYTVTGLPAGVSFSAMHVDGRLTTAEDKVFTVDVVATVESGPYIGKKVTRSFRLTVKGVSLPSVVKPDVAAIADQSAIQNQAFSYQPSVTSTKSGTWSASGLPAGLTIPPQTGQVSGTALNSGATVISITFTDVDGQSDTEKMKLSVSAAPLTSWFLGGGYTSDINTRAMNWFFSIAPGFSTVQFAVERTDGGIDVGNVRSGGTFTTDPAASAGFWQNAYPESSGNGAFNWANSYLPASFGPVVAGLTPGYTYKVRVRRFIGDPEVVLYAPFPTGVNVDPVQTLQQSGSGGGTTPGNRKPAAPAVPAQVAYVGQPFSVEIPYFTDLDNDTLTHVFSEYPATVYSVTDVPSRKVFVFSGTPAATGAFTLVCTCTDGRGGTETLNVEIRQELSPLGVSLVNGRFYAGDLPQNNQMSAVLGGGFLCHYIRLRADSLPSGAVPQVGIRSYGGSAPSSGEIGWTNMVARAENGFTHVEAHQVGIANAGVFWEYYVRIINAAGAVISPAIKIYTRDGSSNADTNYIQLYPAPTQTAAPFEPVNTNASSWGSSDTIWLENDLIKAGFTLSVGGLLTHLRNKADNIGLINTCQVVHNGQTEFDKGRSAGSSGYGTKAKNFIQNGQNTNQTGNDTGINPVQGGNRATSPDPAGVWNKPSPVLICEKRENVPGKGTVLYVRVSPYIWSVPSSAGVSQFIFEVWYWLDGRAVRMFTRIANNRTDTQRDYEAREQEFPFCYATAPYYRHFVYTGQAPYTNGALTEITLSDPALVTATDKEVHGIPKLATEPFIMALEATGSKGIGIWRPDNGRFINKGFQSRAGGETTNDSSYINAAPLVDMDNNGVYEYVSAFVAGTAAQIRAWVYEQQRLTAFDFIFNGSAGGWWNINGAMTLENGKPRINFAQANTDGAKNQGKFGSPFFAWPATDLATIYVKGAFKGLTQMALAWTGPGTDAGSVTGKKTFTVIDDGIERVYAVQMAGTAGFTGIITSIQLCHPDSTTSASLGSNVWFRASRIAKQAIS